MIDSWTLMKNWNQVIPPSRPSKQQLDYLLTFAKNLKKSDTVAVLGSTMEFRDLLYEIGFENIFIFERNIEFYKQTTKSRIYQNKETVVEGNWIDTIQNYKDKFALILSDLTSGNISYDYRSKFYTDIENALSIGGHFYDKVLTHENFISLDSLIKKYEKLPINNETVNHFNCELVFCSELIKETQKVETSTIYKQIKEASSNPRITKFIELCKNNITPEGFIWYYGKLWNELEKEYCKKLTKENEFEDNIESPYFKRVKLFHFIK